MNTFSEALGIAWSLILSGDADLIEIILLSLRVSLSATALAVLIGVPLGACLAALRFPFRRTFIVLTNAMMGLPPVVVGLGLYLLLSRVGPLGTLGLLYTPTAMIIAQAVLVTPIVAALAREAIVSRAEEYEELFASLCLSKQRQIPTLIVEARPALYTAALAGFGRAIAEVGAVMIVGGNIDHATRVMTTTIALETSKGNLALALALGGILLLMALSVNAVAAALSGARRA
ncbi:ABC transporter permease [Paracoccaceae bacterium GXU_MW_L88]